MTTLTEPEVAPAPAEEDDDLTHYYCCDPTVGICGVPLIGVAEDDDPGHHRMCMVCEDLSYHPCEQCGWKEGDPP